LKFRVDTQADVTTVPISLAERERIPYARDREGTARGIAGRVKKYWDRLRVVIAGRVGPMRRWLRRRLHEVWNLFGMVHPAREPLLVDPKEREPA
jgi:hypothetical protein